MKNSVKAFKIGLKEISSTSQVFIIAEIGVNHNGDLHLAKKMIDAAKTAGADAVKFQTFTADALVTPETPKVQYQESTTSQDESHFQMIKNLEMPRGHHHELIEYCQEKEIEFISTPYDVDSAQFLNSCGVKVFKTASADIVDIFLHTYLAENKKPVIIATGMATLEEIDKIIGIYRKAKNGNIILLHCVSNYPCSFKSLNLKVLLTLQDTFGQLIGFSDHSIGWQAASLSVGLGAKVVEKHFTLDKNLPGPDHKASSDPEEFAELVSRIRLTETMMGSPDKKVQAEEQQMRLVSRKSLVTKRELQSGEILSRDDLTVKRPGSGLEPRQIESLQGKKVKNFLPKNTLISLDDVED